MMNAVFDEVVRSAVKVKDNESICVEMQVKKLLLLVDCYASQLLVRYIEDYLLVVVVLSMISD